MFREHVAFGAIVSMVVVVAVYFYALVTDPLLLLFLFGVTVIGSFLPDVDSDSGMPFYLIFGTATLAVTGVVLLYTLSSEYAADWRYLSGIPAAALFFFWFVVGGIVKRCTHHRGIFHSLPATAIAAVGTLLVARYYGLPEEIAWIFGGGMAAGYLCHLILDELHAGITLDGIPFNPKESFGSALKLFSRSSRVNMATYLLLAALSFLAFAPHQALAFYSVDVESAPQLCCGDESRPFQNSAPGGRSYSSKNAMVAAPGVRLAFYNDSDIIELEDDAPPAPPNNPGGTGDSSGTGSGAGQGGVVGGTTGGQGQGSSNSGDGNPPSESGGGSSGNSDDNQSDEDLLDTLISEGLISGSGAVSGSSLFEESLIGASRGSISVDGDGVRRYFRGRYDLQELLLGWRAGADARLSAGGLGYVAASTALRDRNVDTVSFTADRFYIRYRSRGYLLSIIPISFPVRVTVIPEATSERVRVALPWYRFFVREFFTARGLAEDVDEVIQAEIEKNTNPDADLKVVLFTAVAEYLRTKIGTVADTVDTQ